MELIVAPSPFKSVNIDNDGKDMSILTGEVRGVRVHSIEVRRAFDNGPFCRREDWKPVPEHLSHVLRVVAEVDGVLEDDKNDID